MTCRCLVLLVLAMASMACSSAVDGGGEGGGQGAADPEPDLFACDVPVDCTIDYGHLGEVDSSAAQRCAGEIVAAGEPGAILTTSTPGPYPQTIESLYVLHGDGTATVQRRNRCVEDGACEEQATAEWTVSELELCTLTYDPEATAGCGDPEGECSFALTDRACEPVGDDWTCDDLAP